MPSLRITLIPPEGEKMERIIDSHSISVGRSSKCDLILDTESLSRRHCLIEFEDGEFYITDLSSTNGVFIEGKRIKPEVRVPFNNFLPLQISIFDCLIHEVEITAIRNPPILLADHLTPMLTSTKKINSRALNKPFKMLPKDKEKSDINSYIKLGLSGIILLAVLGFALTYKKAEQPLPVAPEVSEATPSHKPNRVENEFLTPHVYLDLFTKRHCDLRVYCDNLFLIMEEAEGIAKENDDYLVFIKPSKHLQMPKYSKLSQDDLDLIAFDLFINSRIMEDYLTGKIAQLHLVIVNSANNPVRVYRFHPSVFSLKAVKRQVINPLLESSIIQNKPQEFWDVILRYVQKSDLPQ